MFDDVHELGLFPLDPLGDAMGVYDDLRAERKADDEDGGEAKGAEQ